MVETSTAINCSNNYDVLRKIEDDEHSRDSDDDLTAEQ